MPKLDQKRLLKYFVLQLMSREVGYLVSVLLYVI